MKNWVSTALIRQLPTARVWIVAGRPHAVIGDVDPANRFLIQQRLLANGCFLPNYSSTDEKDLARINRSTFHHLPLSYSNILMGEFERSGIGQTKGLVWAIKDIFTAANFLITVIVTLIGHVLVEFLRNSLQRVFRC